MSSFYSLLVHNIIQLCTEHLENKFYLNTNKLLLQNFNVTIPSKLIISDTKTDGTIYENKWEDKLKH